MQQNLTRDIFCLFLPILPRLELDDTAKRFLESGGISLLFGETREEYVSRIIDAERIAAESKERWKETIRQARSLAGPVLVAIDAEIGGIERLHRLGLPLPSLETAKQLDALVLEERVKATAQSARALGANVFLSPVADVLTGPNPWLEGRTLSNDIGETARLVSAFVKGVQSGGVAATVKHFPGHPICELDPAVSEGVVPQSFEQLREFSPPFRAGIAAGADVVMMGPAIFEAVNPPTPAGHSPEMVAWLRNEFLFNGVVLTDDLDWKATIRDMKIQESAVKALKAGVDWMLVSANGVPHIPAMVAAITEAVRGGILSAGRIEASAEKLRGLAAKMSD